MGAVPDLRALPNHPGAPVRVLLVEARTLVRKALAEVLATNVDRAEVSEAGDAIEAVAHLYGCPHDVALVDARLPGPGEVGLLRHIHEASPLLPVIVLTDYEDAGHLAEALSEGAVGYLLKDARPGDLALAIRMALSGTGSIIAPRPLRSLLERSSLSPHPQERHLGPDLTPREREILKMVADGATNRWISRQLFLSEKTVKSHLISVYRKLGVQNRTQAALAAVSLQPVGSRVAARAPTREAG